MKPSNNAIQAIKNREKCKLVSYKLAGEDYYTIGWGHLCDRDPQLNRPNVRITQSQADALLVRDVTEKTKILNSVIKIPISQNLYDALVSTVYQYNPNNSTLKNIFRYVNLGYDTDFIGRLIASMPSNSYNKKARRVDQLLAVTGKLFHIDKV